MVILKGQADGHHLANSAVSFLQLSWIIKRRLFKFPVLGFGLSISCIAGIALGPYLTEILTHTLCLLRWERTTLLLGWHPGDQKPTVFFAKGSDYNLNSQVPEVYIENRKLHSVYQTVGRRVRGQQ
jgi:hypothetical protein